ncbi:hypothetical protein TRAPUB_675 [Trametes pubescens]|uniref:Transcription termination and cleavage factor C-terminal domain-containing protein n=1 Tax=Trametes pubescens TaxID=154538 RepID=A0A1M2VLS6_TRAPU|nr:hypothetical protein TRAPUB_675 [Trametes pubescens]
MSAQAMAEDQLLELLLTLKRTTANEARTILNNQPQIAYALMAVMADVGAVKMEVVQETLAKYGALPGAAAPAPAVPVVPPPVPQPAPAIPPHMQAQGPPRGGTPTYPPHGPPQGYPPQTPGYPAHGYGTPPPGPAYGPGAHGQQPPPHVPHTPPHMQPPQHMQPPHMHGAPPPAAPSSGARLPDAFAGLPEEQKAVILRVMQMSREEVYAMPPSERENIIKLRATLGLPT